MSSDDEGTILVTPVGSISLHIFYFYTSLYTLTKHCVRGEIRTEIRGRCVRDSVGGCTWKDSVEDGTGVGGENV